MGIRSMLSRRRPALTLSRLAAGRRARADARPAVRSAADAAVASMEPLEGRTLFAVNYTVVDLGGTANSTARGINVGAQAVGQSGSALHAVRYSASSAVTDLGTLGGRESIAYGINDSGIVVGESFTEAVSEEAPAFRHAFITAATGNKQTDIHPDGTNEESLATAVNNSGLAVGYSFTEGGFGSQRAFAYSGGTTTEVGVLGGASSYSMAFAVNNGGSIAGESATANGTPHAFLRMANATTLTDLGAFNDDPALGSFSTALGINDRNEVVGVSGFTAATRHAFHYTTTGEFVDLGVLRGTTDSRANDINNSGVIVGASADGDQFSDAAGSRAFVFTGGELLDLNALIPANSGWVLEEAFSVNRDGQIVGVGTKGTERKAFRLDPVAEQPPLDTTPPTGSIQVANVATPGGTSFAVTVTYADETNVDRDTIGIGDIEVAKAGGGAALTVTNVTVTPDADGKSLVAVYTVTPPGGTWDAADAGTYNVTVKAGEVKDTAGNAVVNAAGTFDAAFAVQATGPVTNIAAIPTITAAGGTTQAVVVTYTDDAAVDRESIGADDITVTGPSGAAITITGVTISPDGGDAATLTATYTFAAPGGAWDGADNGTYAIVVNGAQVLDATGNAGTGASTNFAVDVAVPQETIDPTFNSGNPVNTQFVAEALAASPDGKIVVAGHQGGAGDTLRAVLKRYNADGSLDTSFGSGGTLVSPDGQDDAYYAVAIDDTGRILAAGSFGGNFAVSRFKANGAADAKFGTKGIITTDFGDATTPTADVAYSFAIAADGSIVAVGGSAGRFAIAKYTANGDLATTFQSGRILIDPSDAGDVLGSVAFSPDGKIVAAGTSGAATAVVRLNADGSTDSTFNGGQVLSLNALAVRTDLGMTDRTVGLAVQADAKIVVANRSSGNDFAVARLNVDGSLDNAFSGDGIATIDFGGDDDADAVQVQGTGEIFVIGTTDAGGPKAAVAVLTADGVLDATFDDDGKFTVDAGIVNQGRALHAGDLVLRAFGGLQSNGRLVVGTRDAAPTVSSSPLRRLNVPGSGIVGSFGNVSGGKARKLSFLDANNTRITVTMKGGGSGQALYNGSEVDLVLTGTNDRTVLTIAGKGGDDNGRIVLSDIRSNGGLKTVAAKTSDLRGTLYVGGNLGTASFARVAGVIAAKGNIAGIAIKEDLAAAKILAGADLGDDALLNGSNGNADAYAAANIGKVAIKGQVIASFVGAGIDPRNGTFGDAGDISVGDTPTIKSIAIKTVDANSRFEAGVFGSIKAPGKLSPVSTDNPAGDVRFRIV